MENKDKYIKSKNNFIDTVLSNENNHSSIDERLNYDNSDNLTKIYDGDISNFYWVGFGSGSGTNLVECTKIIKPVLIFCDRPNAELINRDEFKTIEKIVMNGYEYCGSWKKSVGNSELEKRYIQRSIEFNSLILENLENFEARNNIKLSLIVLGGYMRLIMDPLLTRFKDKIINVHPADLTILDNGKRRYIGDNAVYDAIYNGETKTRSSVIIVDGDTDHGEIITQGPYLEVDYEKLKEVGNSILEYSKIHQNKQKIVSDWPAITTALELIAKGRISIGTKKVYYNEWRALYLDNVRLGYGGLQIEDINKTK